MASWYRAIVPLSTPFTSRQDAVQASSSRLAVPRWIACTSCACPEVPGSRPSAPSTDGNRSRSPVVRHRPIPSPEAALYCCRWSSSIPSRQRQFERPSGSWSRQRLHASRENPCQCLHTFSPVRMRTLDMDRRQPAHPPRTGVNRTRGMRHDRYSRIRFLFH